MVPPTIGGWPPRGYQPLRGCTGCGLPLLVERCIMTLGGFLAYSWHLGGSVSRPDCWCASVAQGQAETLTTPLSRCTIKSGFSTPTVRLLATQDRSARQYETPKIHGSATKHVH